MAKTLEYNDESGNKYKISYSEELQLKNLKATKEQVKWEKLNFYAKILLIAIITILAASIFYTLWKIDQSGVLTHIIRNLK